MRAPVWLLLPALLAPAAGLAAPPSERLSDDQAKELARKALAETNPDAQRSALERLKKHVFRSTRAPQREYVLYAQGILEDRLGQPLQGAVPLQKLERIWPGSPYLPEVQVILATEALERRRFRETETRLRKALAADIPVEGKRRAQELLLATLVEQDRPAEGLPVVLSLHPLGTARPSERGLAAIVEVLAAAGRRQEAEAAARDYHRLYPEGPRAPRVELTQGRMLGAAGDSRGAARHFQQILQRAPNSPEADEARLALATLLSEGRLPPAAAKGLPGADALLAQIRHLDGKDGDPKRRVLMVQLRVHLQASRWKEALEAATQLRATKGDAASTAVVDRLRAEAFRAYAQQQLDGGHLDPLLPLLDREGIPSLSPPQRDQLVRHLASRGLGAAALAVCRLAPPKERPVLQRTAAAQVLPEGDPESLLALAPRQAKPAETLRRAQALAALKRWKELASALPRAQAGPERIALVLSLLRRPLPPQTPAARLREAEGWLLRAPEKGKEREPLTILVADLRAGAGDWKGALALYPAAPAAPEQKGWVALMRATCLHRLKRRDEARKLLQASQDLPGFQMERRTLAREL